MKDLSVLVLAVIAAIIGFLVFGGGGGGDSTYPALDLTVFPAAVHPPQQIEVAVNQGDFPTGTTFEYSVNGGKALPLVGSEDVLLATHPAEIEAKAIVGGKTVKTDSFSVGLINSIPRFRNFWTPSIPEGGARLGFHLYYRERGCDASGAPTAITGVLDNDYPGTDQTDNWEYQVRVMDTETGYLENVYYLEDDGTIALMGANDWTTDPRFVWTPFVREGDAPPVPINIQDFPNVTPRSNIGTAALGSLVDDLLDTGYSWGATSEIAPMSLSTMSCNPVDPGIPVEIPTGDPNKEVIVRVREFGKIYENSYLLFANIGSCDPY